MRLKMYEILLYEPCPFLQTAERFKTVLSGSIHHVINNRRICFTTSHNLTRNTVRGVMCVNV